MKLSRFGLLASIAVGIFAAPFAAEAQPPIRIGASPAQTGAFAALGQDQLRGYQLCVKHTNDKGGVLKALNVNPRMVGLTVGVDLPKFYEVLGRDAEFVYGAAPWLPELVEVRAGGLVPIARQYPGAREFVESYKKEFPGADLSFQSASGYGACQILVEAIRRAGSLDREKLRDAILKMDHNTVFGAFRVDRDGVQIAHKTLLFQWQDGKKVIVWPEELAPNKPRFPTPPWSQRP